MNDKKISQFLSYILRHEPQSIGLELDQEGWADITTLLTCAQKAGYMLSIPQLQQIVHSNDKQHFQVSTDDRFIRAVQGHSTKMVQRQFDIRQPPDILYHGTAHRFIASIQDEGLVAGQRQYVHLSALATTAIQVGQRYGKPQLLKINTQHMQQDGFQFYLSENAVWLVEHVPVQYIDFGEG